jgi:hypothetical protein
MAMYNWPLNAARETLLSVCQFPEMTWPFGQGQDDPTSGLEDEET